MEETNHQGFECQRCGERVIRCAGCEAIVEWPDVAAPDVAAMEAPIVKLEDALDDLTEGRNVL